MSIFAVPRRFSCSLLLGGVLATPAAQAITFNVGGIQAQFDSNLSFSTAWSTASPDARLIGRNNGGRGFAQTGDDGRLNFKRGETFSKRFEGQHALELRYGDSGLFVSGRYWYDFELMDEHRPFRDIDDSGRQTGSQSSGGEWREAYVYHNYQLGNQPGAVRLGRQVLHWGEALFMGGGIDVINPADPFTPRQPGMSMMEARTPVNLFHLSQQLTDDLSAEAFYQLDWQAADMSNCGTFFSGSDLLADGCRDNLAVGPALTSAQLAVINAGLPAGVAPVTATGEGIIEPRAANRHARDSGQWGARLGYYVEPLDTQFGAYFMNYHSRSPQFGGVGPAASVYGLGSEAVVIANTHYFLEYPEDIRLYGLSFSSTLPTGTRWRGELSYRPNAPVGLSPVDLLNAGLTPINADRSLVQAEPGSTVDGYRRKEVTQLQTSLTQLVDDVMGAERLTLAGEVAWAHTGGLEDGLRYGRATAYGPGPLPNGQCEAQTGGASRYCENDGFVTEDAWGYRLRAAWTYRQALPGLTLLPSVAWSHDVEGYGPNGSFNEGSKAVALGVMAVYQDVYRAGLSYTDFFGGRYNTLADRDYLVFDVGMRF